MYASERWRKLRIIYLRRHPLCKDCEAVGMVTPATEVDHITAWRKGGTEARQQELLWDWHNLQALCKSCHSRKTMREVRTK